MTLRIAARQREDGRLEIEVRDVLGRIVAPMGTGGGQQALVVIDKTRHGVQQRVLEAVHFVPLKSGVV